MGVQYLVCASGLHGDHGSDYVFWPVTRGNSTVGRSATLAVEAVKTQQFSSFEDMVRDSKVPVLVDFHAQWCGPCKLMGDSLRVSVRPPRCNKSFWLKCHLKTMREVWISSVTSLLRACAAKNSGKVRGWLLDLLN